MNKFHKLRFFNLKIKEMIFTSRICRPVRSDTGNISPDLQYNKITELGEYNKIRELGEYSKLGRS